MLMQEFSYQDISEALERIHIAADAAECHGALSAVICLNGADGQSLWLGSHFPQIEQQVSQGDALAKQVADLLTGLYGAVSKQLLAGHFEYELLLPDDDVDLELRTEAMAHWCQGFLLGLGYSGVTDPAKFSGELGEIIDDITEISQVTVGELEYTEEEERSYTELVEYLRVGVMLIKETLLSSDKDNLTSTLH